MITIRKLTELCSKATKGPWSALPPSSGRWVKSDTVPVLQQIEWSRNHENDAAFIAAARTAIPLLIKALELSVENNHAVLANLNGEQKPYAAGCICPDFWLEQAVETT